MKPLLIVDMNMQEKDRFRITSHPIIPVVKRREIRFSFNGKEMKAYEGEAVTSALFANGIKVFGHHRRDNGPQGIFCVNGQCSQCMVIADGIAVKGCMTVVKEGMEVRSCDTVPVLPEADKVPGFKEISTLDTEVLVIGGGPAGINAAIELGKLGIEILLVDDKPELGGKLTLQTHTFFGSKEECYAGTRGFDIARLLTDTLGDLETVTVMLDTAAIGAFYDGSVGLYGKGGYTLVRPKAALVACGAREKTLAFPGCDLPGVYGAGAFQTLLNRDLIRPTDKLFIVGGGNVGLIAGYHAIQAGIKVVGLVEALPECGGYKVHLDKLRRLGVPVLTSHTVIKAHGGEHLDRITIARLNSGFEPVEGTARDFEVDTLLIAVGLSPINELYDKLTEFGIESYKAGDAEEISEASAAIFSGKIVGRGIARSLGYDVEIPPGWDATAQTMKSKPGIAVEYKPERMELESYPLIMCVEEIPCNPCVDSCPRQSIKIHGDPIMGLPVFEGDCIACLKCVDICPGLAINLVKRNYDQDRGTSLLVIPFELDDGDLIPGRKVNTVDMEGNPLGHGSIVDVRKSPIDSKRRLVSIEVPNDDALKAASFSVQEAEEGMVRDTSAECVTDDTIICRCERVTAGEIRSEIRAGIRDMNVLKATLRTGMGACGGKSCTELILKLYEQEGVDLSEVTLPTNRPFVSEIPLSAFAGVEEGGGE